MQKVWSSNVRSQFVELFSFTPIEVSAHPHLGAFADVCVDESAFNKNKRDPALGQERLSSVTSGYSTFDAAEVHYPEWSNFSPDLHEGSSCAHGSPALHAAFLVKKAVHTISPTVKVLAEKINAAKEKFARAGQEQAVSKSEICVPTAKKLPQLHVATCIRTRLRVNNLPTVCSLCHPKLRLHNHAGMSSTEPAANCKSTSAWCVNFVPEQVQLTTTSASTKHNMHIMYAHAMHMCTPAHMPEASPWRLCRLSTILHFWPHSMPEMC